jgi:hypothetical protein
VPDGADKGGGGRRFPVAGRRWRLAGVVVAAAAGLAVSPGAAAAHAATGASHAGLVINCPPAIVRGTGGGGPGC